MTIAVFDIDGVVADVRHRLHYLQQRPKDWDSFFRAARHDEVLAEGEALVHEWGATHDIVWLTGRPAWLRPITREWLTRAGLPADELHMRGNSDRRPARAYKVAVLRSLSARTVVSFIDDDTEVVDAALAAGMPAVLATWLPRTEALGGETLGGQTLSGQTLGAQTLGAQTLRDAQEREGRT